MPDRGDSNRMYHLDRFWNCQLVNRKGLKLRVAHKKQQYPTFIPVPIGAPEALVSRRQLVNKYEVNRDIKTFSTWYMLKALTESNKISDWRAEADTLLPWLQMNYNTFYKSLRAMEAIGLIEVDPHWKTKGTIYLATYKRSAEILDIPHIGQQKIEYDPEKFKGGQSFQYLLRAEEIRCNQSKQQEALWYYSGKNLSVHNTLHALMCKQGADERRLKIDVEYFQKRLLAMQKHAFREGSETWTIIKLLRADINRSVTKIKEHHCYQSKQSSSYMTNQLRMRGIAEVKQELIESKHRTRITLPDGTDGYKWSEKKKQTLWRLTNQITVKFQTHVPERKQAATTVAA